MEFDALMAAFAEKLGGGLELVQNDAGAIALTVDDMPLTILHLDEIGKVVLIGEVGEAPPEDRMERLYKAMLVANHNFAGTFGATFSVNPDDGKVMLCKALPLELADAETFFAEVERFVNTLETWRKLVADFRAAPDAVEPETENVPVGGLGGCMQV